MARDRRISDSIHGHHWLGCQIEMIWKAHITNWLWRTREERRNVRNSVTARCIDRYLEAYRPFIRSIHPDETPVKQDEPEKIWSIWLQGEDAAPAIVKACWRSIRANNRDSGHELVILDEKTLFDHITLPGHIMDRWNSGNMSPAHFCDICRIELLHEHGGVWVDATDFVAGEFPQWLWEEDFFVYLAGNINGFTFMQNCFISARKGAFLTKVWRELIYKYWEENRRHLHYFQHQMMFHKVVTCNDYAAEAFARMRKINQEPTHYLWWNLKDKPFNQAEFDAVTSKAMFQKTTYRSASAKKPIPGSYADVMLGMYPDA